MIEFSDFNYASNKQNWKSILKHVYMLKNKSILNKLKTEVCCHLHHWNEVHDHVNVYKDWNLTCADVKRYEYE